VLEDDLGTGLDLSVTPLVKSVTSPITFAEKLCIPLTIEAAKAEPGRLGSETPLGGRLPALGVEGAEATVAGALGRV